MVARLAAFLAGLVSAGAALYLLVADAVDSGVWTQDHKLLPFFVLLAVASGCLVEMTLRTWRFGFALFFTLTFAVFTFLTIQASVSRQTRTAENSHLAAADINDRVAVARRALRRNEAMLAEARELLARRCPLVQQSECNKIKDTITVYEAAVLGSETRLKELGPGVAEDTGAQKIADLIRLFFGSSGNTKQILETMKPFLVSLGFELMSIAAFAFAFTPTRLKPTRQPPDQPTRQPTVQPPDPPPANPPGDGGLISTRQPTRQPPVVIPPKRPPNGVSRLVVVGGLDSIQPGVDINPDLQKLVILSNLSSQGVVTLPQSKLMKPLGFSTRQSVREFLKRLETSGHIQLETSPKGTQIRIITRN